MPAIQVRDVPEHIYRMLTEQARKERRSLAQQVVAVLARGLEVTADATARRRALLEQIRSYPPVNPGKLGSPTKLIRQDRNR
jgi:hypothetical protein